MTKTLDELRQRAEELGCEIVTENPGGDDVDDPGPYWLIDVASGGYLVCPGLSSCDLIEEELDLIEEEASRPRTPTGMTDEDRAEIARKIADRPTIRGSGERKTPRFIEIELAGQLDLFKR